MTEPTQSSTPEPTPEGSDTSDQRSAQRVVFVADRRAILRAGGLALCAGALAACSSPPVPTASPSSTAAGSSTASSSTAGSAATASSSGAAGAGTPISEVPVGGAAFYPETNTIVTQPEAGVLKAFDMTCPHQQNPVRRVEDGNLVCPSHDSHFDLSTGARVSGPAETGLTPKTVTVTGDTFTVS